MSSKSENFLEGLKSHESVKFVLDAVSRGYSPAAVEGALGGLSGTLATLAHLAHEGKPTLVVAPDPMHARDIFRDAAFTLEILDRNQEEELFLFEELNLLAQDFLTLGELEVIFYRYRVLEQLITGEPVMVVTSKQALGTPLVAPARYRDNMIHVRVGDKIDKNKFLRNLFDIGYRLVSRVREVGQVAGRGGIIDIYPPGRKRPVRIDLFGDDVESLREFDPESQKSLGQTESLTISPCFEAELLRDQDPENLFDVEGELRDAGRLSIDPVRFREFSDEEKKDFQARGYSYFDKAGMWDYLPENTLVIVQSPGTTFGSIFDKELITKTPGDGARLPEHDGLVHSVEDIARGLSIFQRLEFLSPICPIPSKGEIAPKIQSKPITSPPGSFDRRLEQLLEHHLHVTDDYPDGNLVIVSRSSERIIEMLGDRKGVSVLYGDYSNGYDLSPAGPVVLSDSELFPTRQRGFSKARGKVRAFTREELREVRIGDYMVHVHFGVGVFQGIVQQAGHEGSLRDYVLLEYAQNDKLYVPVEQIDQLFRYTSGEGAAPAINRLGSSDWDRLKRKVKKNLVRIAEDLLKLYRTRMEVAGHNFSPDTVWQLEVEDKFEFQETPGQLKSLDELKSDMESQKPMDRLICAEVGYGKTELAVRAALKCVLDGMQAAVLVPTTILAQQHFMTFTERLKDLPLTVDVLSRFRSTKEQKETLQAVKEGKVDILIGTHRILSKDVFFNNLGLLIVDEEQKFGVRHKEKIKFLKSNIDVLTLTATPIPRTLYMSLIGLRDISIIDTPPPDRLPIKTFVKRWNPHLVRTAIQAELARGGQVYYVHNRVETIFGAAKRLQEIVPSAKIAVAHGQMEETQLEKIMFEFMAGEHDILVCTTIIENGLDISRVNTLIVEDAQNFGLAQLHQIRGRVGRSEVQAYAYFLFPMTKSITGLAAKRLEALASFSHLGAGYEIAKRDLELRGAGNILGPEQHGFVNQLGFDLYSHVLAETIEQVRSGNIDYDNIGTSGRAECTFKLPIDARIPTEYLLDQSERYALYKKLSEANTMKDIEDLRLEMQDRFGTLPEEAENLLYIMKLRLRAMACGVVSIAYDRPKRMIEVLFQYAMHSDPKWKRIGDLVDRARLRPLPRGFLIPTSGEPDKVLKQVEHLIGELEKACSSIARPANVKAVK